MLATVGWWEWDGMEKKPLGTNQPVLQPTERTMIVRLHGRKSLVRGELVMVFGSNESTTNTAIRLEVRMDATTLANDGQMPNWIEVEIPHLDPRKVYWDWHQRGKCAKMTQKKMLDIGTGQCYVA